MHLMISLITMRKRIDVAEHDLAASIFSLVSSLRHSSSVHPKLCLNYNCVFFE